jgi:putative acetyltransferase
MISIKTYTEQMKPQLFELTDNCFRQCAKQFDPNGRHSFYNDIVHNFVQFWCAFDGDTMIGTSALKSLTDTKCELKALYLDEKYHGKGLGSTLAQTAIDFARQQGFTEIYLDCMSTSTAAVKLYEKLGFHKTERFNKNFFCRCFYENASLSVAKPLPARFQLSKRFLKKILKNPRKFIFNSHRAVII